ncbi:ester cyclase [Hamadaea sp. NPDC050747]|uniref:ester cyclase n=1 Tax=Hamadaea sp. NPDC050747 TaxID=3155789 RepID=UPI0033F57039
MTTEPDLIELLFELWTVPPDLRTDPVADFGTAYADPVLINGVPMALADLVERARLLHHAFEEHSIEIMDRTEQPGKVAVAFRHTARHTGTWRTPIGEIAPTGRTVSGLGIDLLTVVDGRIAMIWVLADELQRIMQVREI